MIGKNKIPFDINVLCQIIETLAVRLVLSYHLDVRKTLHNMVLLQSWIAKIGPASHRHKEDLCLLPAFVEFTSVLLEGLWARQDRKTRPSTQFLLRSY